MISPIHIGSAHLEIFPSYSPSLFYIKVGWITVVNSGISTFHYNSEDRFYKASVSYIIRSNNKVRISIFQLRGTPEFTIQDGNSGNKRNILLFISHYCLHIHYFSCTELTVQLLPLDMLCCQLLFQLLIFALVNAPSIHNSNMIS